jgi:hypothetical protein
MPMFNNSGKQNQRASSAFSARQHKGSKTGGANWGSCPQQPFNVPTAPYPMQGQWSWTPYPSPVPTYPSYEGMDQGKGEGKGHGKGPRSKSRVSHKPPSGNKPELNGLHELTQILEGNATVYCPWHIRQVLTLLRGSKMEEEARAYAKKVYECQTDVNDQKMDQSHQREALNDLYQAALKLLLVQAAADPEGKRWLKDQSTDGGSGGSGSTDMTA